MFKYMSFYVLTTAATLALMHLVDAIFRPINAGSAMLACIAVGVVTMSSLFATIDKFNKRG